MTRKLKRHAVLFGSVLFMVWLLELVDLVVFGGALDAYAIQLRPTAGLRGIALAPLGHLRTTPAPCPATSSVNCNILHMPLSLRCSARTIVESFLQISLSDSEGQRRAPKPRCSMLLLPP